MTVFEMIKQMNEQQLAQYLVGVCLNFAGVEEGTTVDVIKSMIEETEKSLREEFVEDEEDEFELTEEQKEAVSMFDKNGATLVHTETGEKVLEIEPGFFTKGVTGAAEPEGATEEEDAFSPEGSQDH